jgi:hypothetical protein
MRKSTTVLYFVPLGLLPEKVVEGLAYPLSTWKMRRRQRRSHFFFFLKKRKKYIIPQTTLEPLSVGHDIRNNPPEASTALPCETSLPLWQKPGTHNRHQASERREMRKKKTGGGRCSRLTRNLHLRYGRCTPTIDALILSIYSHPLFFTREKLLLKLVRTC